LDIQTKHDGAQTVVSLHGRFVFDCHRDFRGVMTQTLKDVPGDIHLDLGGVDYLDSSALGMLLVLRDRAQAAGRRIHLRTRPGTVEDLLDIAGVSQLFAIS
jgi:anti-anti-sigma factor